MTRWRLIKALLAVSAIAIVGLGVAAGVAASRDSGSNDDATVRLQDDGSDATAWLGIHGTDSEDPPGVRIVEVVDGTGADVAGIARDDVITAIDGDELTTIEQLRDAVAGHSVGDEVTLSVVKRGEGGPSEVVATLGERPPYYDLLGKIGEYEFEDLRDRLGDALDEIFPDGFDAFLDGTFRYQDSNGDTHDVTAVSGTVTGLSDDSLTIESADGDSRSFDLTDDTHVPNDLASGDDVLVVIVDGNTQAVIAPDHILDNIPIPGFQFDFDNIPLCDDEAADDRPEGLHDLICEGKFDFRIPEHCDNVDSSTDDPTPEDEWVPSVICTRFRAMGDIDLDPLKLFCESGQLPFLPLPSLFDEQRIRDEYCD